MAEQALEGLLQSTYTRDNVHKKILLLKEFFSNYFFKEHGDYDMHTAFKHFLSAQQITPYMRETLLGLDDSFYSYFNGENFTKALDQLEEEVNNRPLIQMYVPTLLPPAEVERLGRWFRENVAEGMFMDISVDSSSIGGCIFVYNGVRHDFSLSYYLEKNKTEVKQLLKDYDNE